MPIIFENRSDGAPIARNGDSCLDSFVRLRAPRGVRQNDSAIPQIVTAMMVSPKDVEQDCHELRAWLVSHSALEGIDCHGLLWEGKYHVDENG
jgi:hypothetical protein